jgi:hypothetical protein
MRIKRNLIQICLLGAVACPKTPDATELRHRSIRAAKFHSEIERWVLSWGGDAKVLKPRELAKAVRQSANKILQVARSKSFANAGKINVINIFHKWKLW